MTLGVLILLVAQSVIGPPAIKAAPEASKSRYDACIDLATSDPAKAAAEATAWRAAGGRYLARQCLGIALANQDRLEAAATEFEGAATEATTAKDNRAGRYWAQAGNAWLAAGKADAARAALDAAIDSGTLTGLLQGEAVFDRGRAFVALGDLPSARTDIDRAIGLAPADPLIWLASATLARRMDDLPRARIDIAEAVKRSPDDASVHLENGNIAAIGGDEAGAKAAWNTAARIAPTSTAGLSARAALKQFDTAKDPDTR